MSSEHSSLHCHRLLLFPPRPILVLVCADALPDNHANTLADDFADALADAPADADDALTFF